MYQSNSQKMGHDGHASCAFLSWEASWKMGKGKTPQISIKWLDQIKSKAVAKAAKRRRLQPGMKALQEIHWFQKSTELLIPKLPFLRLVWEILQQDHGCYHIQAGAVLVLHEATEAYVIQFKKTQIYAQLCKVNYDITLRYAISQTDQGENY